MRGAVGRGVDTGYCNLYFRPDGEVCRIRFQQVPFGRLCVGLVSDDLVEGALSGRFHGGGAVRGYGYNDKVVTLIEECRSMN